MDLLLKKQLREKLAAAKKKADDAASDGDGVSPRHNPPSPPWAWELRDAFKELAEVVEKILEVA
jgi:hypothetical protein